MVGPDFGKCDVCNHRIDCLTNFGNDQTPWEVLIA
jgi:hypothetical protein